MSRFGRAKALFRGVTLTACGSLALQPWAAGAALAASTTTPIKHLVVIFQENVSFDHYFATYPLAQNPTGEPAFKASPKTPNVNGLNGALLSNNPNALNPANASLPLGAAPFRLDRTQASTCDQDHDYTAEQQAFDLGLMDGFPAFAGTGSCGGFDWGYGAGVVMGYFDGNTVTALWNYAQNFAMSDNSYGTDFGPSSVGALNLVSGQTGGVTATANSPDDTEVLGTTVIGDPQPLGDICSSRDQAQLSGKNVGDLLNAAGVTWGFFEGGFDLTITNPNGTTGCNRSHPSTNGGTKVDYIPHHEPFQYYKSTQNLNHTRPSSVGLIGTSSDGANHQYDLHDFSDALLAGNLPSVSFVKAARFQDGHAGYSNPLNEQFLIVSILNMLQKTAYWKSTAVVIAYDDSDGWYDHQMSPIINPSATTADVLSGTGKCGNGAPLGGIEGRCGYGPRLPLLVISPFARANFVDHTLTDQTSILKFIETNWSVGSIGGGSFDTLAGSLNNMFDFSGKSTQPTLILDPNTGEPT
jgi:phospholipase C